MVPVSMFSRCAPFVGADAAVADGAGAAAPAGECKVAIRPAASAGLAAALGVRSQPGLGLQRGSLRWGADSTSEFVETDRAYQLAVYWCRAGTCCRTNRAQQAAAADKLCVTPLAQAMQSAQTPVSVACAGPSTASQLAVAQSLTFFTVGLGFGFRVGFGFGAGTTGFFTVGFGFGAGTTGFFTVGFGFGAGTTGFFAVGLGFGAGTTGFFTVGFGFGAGTTGFFTVGFGFGAGTTGFGAGATGAAATTAGLALRTSIMNWSWNQAPAAGAPAIASWGKATVSLARGS